MLKVIKNGIHNVVMISFEIWITNHVFMSSQVVFPSTTSTGWSEMCSRTTWLRSWPWWPWSCPWIWAAVRKSSRTSCRSLVPCCLWERIKLWSASTKHTRRQSSRRWTRQKITSVSHQHLQVTPLAFPFNNYDLPICLYVYNVLKIFIMHNSSYKNS